ncbi:porphobilinogen deaminase isoform X2 [Diachasma alloeum]|uniref:porphobilinogen deaminase isoform X2 n=1 Tax=Diachasma alloeum TaxID=454923 RepID=UPI0007382E3E|nr:porphobilinogen deaminase isoform X2 [Diachasma alloeum]
MSAEDSRTAEVIRIGSRKSELALIQTRYVIACLKEIHPDKSFEIVTMSTKGDKILDISLPKIGEKALFTQELELALESGRVDFLVHSLKDLPTTLPEGMALGAVLKREDPRDAVVMSKKMAGKTLATLPEGSVIGTSSLRRSAQLARNMPHLKIESIRGLKRMGWDDRISQLLEPDEALYAVGQGALGIECRESDWKILSLLEPLYDVDTTINCVCERSFLKTLGGGCSAPVAVCSSLKEKHLTITGAVWSLNGQTLIKDTLKKKLYLPDDDDEPPKKCPYREPRLYCSIAPGKVSSMGLLGAEQLGKELAESLINKNALEVMSKAREEVLSTS